MNDALFERWLYESESDSLDFKEKQYKFKNASNDEKSELLKDILAMINSWRRVDGYIVIGIEEKPEKPNILHGVTEHIDDASVQQFINSKVSGICTFGYSTHTKDTKTYGIIRIPVEKRPAFLLRDYGRLKAKTVYVRRGSATEEADPDEIAKMGAQPEGEIIVQTMREEGEKNRKAIEQLGNRITQTQTSEPEPNKFLSIEQIKKITEEVTGRETHLLSNYGSTLGNVPYGSKQTFTGFDFDLEEPVVFNLFERLEIGYGGIILKHVNNDIEAQFFAYIHTISVLPITIKIYLYDKQGQETVSFTSHLVPFRGIGCFIQVNRAPMNRPNWEEEVSLTIEISSE